MYIAANTRSNEEINATVANLNGYDACNTLQHTATHCNTKLKAMITSHCNTLQHTATHCNTKLEEIKDKMFKVRVLSFYLSINICICIYVYIYIYINIYI